MEILNRFKILINSSGGVQLCLNQLCRNFTSQES